ncbi:MAG: hypothetical protein ABWK01_02780 [Infirmifilum sp.]
MSHRKKLPSQTHGDPVEAEFRRKKRNAFIVGIVLSLAPVPMAIISLFVQNTSPVIEILSISLVGAGLIYFNYQLQEAYSYKLFLRVKALLESRLETQPPPATQQIVAAPTARSQRAARPPSAVVAQPPLTRQQQAFVQRPAATQPVMQPPPREEPPLLTPGRVQSRPFEGNIRPPQAPGSSGKVCPNCGRELPYGDLHLICPYCGAPLK